MSRRPCRRSLRYEPRPRRYPAAARNPQKIPQKAPYRVLDAPELAEDFYLNLVDWSSTNILGVGLGACVYLWSAQNANAIRAIPSVLSPRFKRDDPCDRHTQRPATNL